MQIKERAEKNYEIRLSGAASSCRRVAPTALARADTTFGGRSRFGCWGASGREQNANPATLANDSAAMQSGVTDEQIVD